MKRPPVYWKKAKRTLSKRDSVLRKIIKKYKKGFLTTRNNPFFSLCRTIVGQQISTKAADSIWFKFEKKCKRNIKPKTILKISSRNLKSAGLTRQKISYLKNIAKAFASKSFDIAKIKKMDDNDAINYITKLKGLCVWSAEMFLMFNLNRPNIFPEQDIGLLKAISKNYKTNYPPSKEQLKRFKKKWDPYCSVATWYLWRSLDPIPISY